MLVIDLKEGELIPVERGSQVTVLKIGWSKVKVAITTTPEVPVGQDAAQQRPPNQQDGKTRDDSGFVVYPVFF